MTNEVIEHLMEIKERLATIETKIEANEDMKSQVQKNTTEIVKAKASIKTLRWVFGIMLITVPATLAAAVKIWRP